MKKLYVKPVIEKKGKLLSKPLPNICLEKAV